MPIFETLVGMDGTMVNWRCLHTMKISNSKWPRQKKVNAAVGRKYAAKTNRRADDDSDSDVKVQWHI